MKTLIVFCDLKFTAASYDFTVFLVRAMKEKQDRGCDGLHVVLVPDEKGHCGIARKWGEHDEAATMWRLWHIVIAMCPLAGASVTLAASRSQAEAMHESEWAKNLTWWPQGKAHFAKPLIEAARRGEKIPKLRATDAARRYVAEWIKDSDLPIVTLTVREQATSPERNSDGDAWNKFWESIVERYSVIWFQDTHVSLCSISGKSYQLDIDLRLALYERASMNLIGNNGPSTLLQFSESNYIVFGFGIPAESWTKHMAEHFAMQPGDQFPWANKNQRVVWKPDTFEVMKAEFEKWESSNR